MSMDYIPLGVDYTKSRAERRREVKENWYNNMKPTPTSGPNRKMRRSGKIKYRMEDQK